jgi:cytochrome c nitrite reductase small subunit
MTSNIFHFFIPPPEWQLAVVICLGVLAGIGIYILYISNASSYLSSDPQACINCHVMIPQYATWQRSSHVQGAGCMDCHVPHDNIARKYAFKLKDGLRHATIFTLRQEPQVIRMKEEGKAVVQENCLRCHQAILEETSLDDWHDRRHALKEGRLCWNCHREVPHGMVRSLSATPYARTPDLPGSPSEGLKSFLSFPERLYPYKKEKDNIP